MNWNQIKLVMTDLDDTLLNDQKECSTINTQAIKKLKEAGIKFGIATGRGAHLIPRFLKQWGIEGYVDYIIGSNGAEVYDVHADKMECFHFLSVDTILRIEEEYRQFPMAICLYNQHELWTNKSIYEYESRLEAHKLTARYIDYKKDVQKPYPKILGILPETLLEEVLRYSKEHPDPHYRVFSSGKTLLEFVHPDLSKSYGIAYLCKKLNIDMQQVVAFGDASNDIEMLKDCCGVAMNNASDEVKSYAQYIADDANASGFGNFILKHIVE